MRSERTCSAWAERDGLTVELGEGTDPGEGALELPDVVLDVGSDEFEDVVGDLLVFAQGLGAQDGQAGLEVGRVDLGDEARQEPAAQPVLEGLDRLGRPVRGQDDLLRGALEVVVGVKELLLEALFALHELDVVDQEDVAIAIATLESQGGRGAQGVDEVVHERLGRDVEDLAAGVVLGDVVPDGVKKMGLAEPGVPVDEKGVVGTSGCFGHGLGGRMSQPVRGCGDEGLEGEFRVQLDSRRLPADPGRLDGLSSSLGFGGQDQEFFGGALRCRGAALLDLEAPPDRHPHLVGQGVLDHREVARLHPLADESVRHGQDEHAVGVAHGLDARQPELPRALRHLVAQRPGAPCPKISSLRHWYSRTPLLPPRRPATCSERSSVRVIRSNVHRDSRCD